MSIIKMLFGLDHLCVTRVLRMGIILVTSEKGIKCTIGPFEELAF